MRGIEIAFAGRSNVGKSSLINALTGRKALARTSRTPGRTQELIFFTGGAGLDARRHAGLRLRRRGEAKIAAWTELIHAYLRGRANLARVYVLIDARHGLKDRRRRGARRARPGRGQPPDRADQVPMPMKPAELRDRIAEVEAALAKRPAAFPERAGDLLARRGSASRNCARPSRGCSTEQNGADALSLTAARSARTAPPMRPKQ